jgi:hypothetical protein
LPWEVAGEPGFDGAAVPVPEFTIALGDDAHAAAGEIRTTLAIRARPPKWRLDIFLLSFNGSPEPAQLLPTRQSVATLGLPAAKALSRTCPDEDHHTCGLLEL